MQAGQGEIDVASTLEAMPSGAFLFDARGKLLVVNRQAMRMFGFRSFDEAADETEGRTHALQPVTMQGAPHETPALVQRALAGEVSTEDLERVAPLDGKPQRIVRASFAPVVSRDGEIVGVIKITRDVTVEYELARRKDEFVRVSTHELRTPTTVLRLHAQRLLRGSPTPEGLRASAEAIDRATRRIETLTVKLHDIATVAAGEPIPFQPSAVRLDILVTDVVQSLEPDQARRVRTTTAPAEVCADETRLREVVEALLDNALRYSAAAGSVEVDVRPRDGQVELSVADHGIGIPQAKQPHLFEQFYRAHVNTPFDRGGLGASLYLADRIVKQHGGRIWFESTERRGSTFHVALRASS
jgi:PAS domain S-box-containing protein